MMAEQHTQQGWQALDQALFSKAGPALDVYDSMPVYGLLRLGKERLASEKATFMAARAEGEVYEPNLRPDFDSDPVADAKTTLLEMRAGIKKVVPRDETTAAVKNVYRWKINAAIGDLKIAEAAKAGDMRAFKDYNYFLFGSPDPAIMRADINKIRLDALGMVAAPQSRDAHEAASHVLDILPGYDMQDAELPDQELFDMVKARHRGFFAMAMEGITLDGNVQGEAGIMLVEQMLDNLGATSDGLDYGVDGVDSAAASVLHSQQKVKYPLQAVYTPERFTGLYGGHELGTHIAERIKGRKSGFKLLEKGFDRHEIAGEGKGTLREQLAYASMAEFNKLQRSREISYRHLTAAFALGTDGTKRTFSEVFTLTTAIETIYKQGNAKDVTLQQAQDQAADYSWNLLTGRILKGASGAGAAYLKDTVYKPGNLRYWRLAKEHPELIDSWDIGKSDLPNPRHMKVLKTLGILPGDVK